MSGIGGMAAARAGAECRFSRIAFVRLTQIRSIGLALHRSLAPTKTYHPNIHPLAVHEDDDRIESRLHRISDHVSSWPGVAWPVARIPVIVRSFSAY